MVHSIKQIAYQILELNPDVVPTFRLIRDVLKTPPSSPEYTAARRGLDRSETVKELLCEQWSDGGWGAFHSRSTRIKQKIPSTEVGVERALSLGFNKDDECLKRVSEYILAIMHGKTVFPDYHEKNDRWQTGMRMFLASTLALIDPNHAELHSDRKLWHEILCRSFHSGKYREEDEIRVHAELTGASVKDSYLVLNNRYQVNLLTSDPDLVPVTLQKSLLNWIWNQPDGIGYLDIPLNQAPPTKPGRIDRWMSSLEMLCRFHPSCFSMMEKSMEWLWKQRNDKGLWDFGPRPGSLSFFPLSDSWRKRNNRTIDWSTRTLLLLSKYYSAKVI